MQSANRNQRLFWAREGGRDMRRTWCCLGLVIAGFFICAGVAISATKPTTVAELALYKGANRQQILEEGAKKEGKLTFYTTHVANKPLVDAFIKKYPFIKVDVWRADTG